MRILYIFTCMQAGSASASLEQLGTAAPSAGCIRVTVGVFRPSISLQGGLEPPETMGATLHHRHRPRLSRPAPPPPLLAGLLLALLMEAGSAQAQQPPLPPSPPPLPTTSSRGTFTLLPATRLYYSQLGLHGSGGYWDWHRLANATSPQVGGWVGVCGTGRVAGMGAYCTVAHASNAAGGGGGPPAP